MKSSGVAHLSKAWLEGKRDLAHGGLEGPMLLLLPLRGVLRQLKPLLLLIAIGAELRRDFSRGRDLCRVMGEPTGAGGKTLLPAVLLVAAAAAGAAERCEGCQPLLLPQVPSSSHKLVSDALPASHLIFGSFMSSISSH
jgi:hypothetical protein